MIGMHGENFSNPPKKIKPDAGLEPATVGLKVQRSTDWANQAPERCAVGGILKSTLWRIEEELEEFESSDEVEILRLLLFKKKNVFRKIHYQSPPTSLVSSVGRALDF